MAELAKMAMIGGVVTVVLIAIIIPLWIIIAQRKAKAKQDYHDALQRLKRDPNNPDQLEEALKSGRRYSTLSEDLKGRKAFGEAAIRSDIAAARAGATVKVEVTNPIAIGGKSVAHEIEELGRLLVAGVITGEEFERGKALFLGAPPDTRQGIVVRPKRWVCL